VEESPGATVSGARDGFGAGRRDRGAVLVGEIGQLRSHNARTYD
jgi:hypothetical protein